MVHELRPRVAWDKGKAVGWLLEILRRQGDAAAAADATDDRNGGGGSGGGSAGVAQDGAPGGSGCAEPLLAIYLGYDVADEDAFRAIVASGGLAIKVADGRVARSATAAAWSVPQPQVVDLLASLASLAGGDPAGAASGAVAEAPAGG